MRIITYVANLIDYKGHLDLLEAWKLVLSRVSMDRSFLRLWLIGTDRGERKPLENKIHIDGIPGVIFWGHQEDTQTFLKKTDIYVHPSLEEGCSNAILEAMAAGLPVIATDVGGNPELVEDMVTGYIVPVSDPVKLARSIVSLINEPRLAEDMGKEGQRRVQELFSMEKMFQDYEELYVWLCGNG